MKIRLRYGKVEIEAESAIDEVHVKQVNGHRFELAAFSLSRGSSISGASDFAGWDDAENSDPIADIARFKESVDADPGAFYADPAGTRI